MTVILHHYRPHLDKAEDLEAISVAREPLLDEMFSRLQRWEPGASRQHYLLIGPRGIGKTHVLRLLLHRLSSVPSSERKWFPLSFAEEQYAVTSVPDLLIETLRALAEASGDHALAERYQRVRREGDDQAVVDLTLDALRNFCKARACGVLLMLENLDRLLQDQIKKDSQIGLLRKILIEEDWPVLIATSPTYLSDVTDPQKPFFEFFQVVVLDELSPEGVETLLRKRAELAGNSDFLAYLKRYRSRLRALYHFSGGNPRLTLMLYDLLSRQALTDVKIELDGLLNQLTPFYQDRMKEVGPQEAKILTTIALLAEGITPTELAEECRMDRTLVRALLSRLEKAGYVRHEPRARKQTVYTIPERFFRIWHQMTASRLARGRIQYLLDFFSTWYATPEERDEVWDCLLTQFQEGAECGEDARIEDISAYMDYIAAVSEGAERFERHFDRLRQHAQAGDTDYVLRELEALDLEFAGDAEYFVHKGEFFARELQSDQMAFEAFRQAADISQDQLEARFNEAVALDKLGRRGEALDAYRRVIGVLFAQRGHMRDEDTTQFLVHLLAEELDDRLFKIAAHLLGRTGDPAVGAQLVHVLQTAATPWRRAHCAIALGLLGATATSPALTECLRDEDDYVRGCAATALGWIGASDAVLGLIAGLNDGADNVRGSAATALGRMRASEAVPELIVCLNDTANKVRGSAATALGEISDYRAVSGLIVCLSDNARDVRGSAATALGRIGASEAVPALITCLSDTANNVRGSAATALGRIGASEAVPALIACLRDEADNVRGSSATALGRMRASEAVPGLIVCLSDQANDVRGSAAAALGRIGATEAIPGLITCLSDQANDVRGSAAAALGRIGASGALPELIACLSDTANRVRGSAATALGRIGASEAASALINCLHHDVDPVNRGAAATALGKIGAPGAVPALIDCLYHDGDSLNRAAAATALASIGAHEAVPALAACLSDKADEVRSSAATALGRIVTEKTVAIVADAISALAQALNLRTEAARVIGAGSFLRAAFRSGNPEVAQRFVEGFVSGIDNGEEAFLPHRIALNFLRSNRDLMILSRQPPEMREAVELLISLFDQNGKGD